MRWDIFCQVIDNYGDIGVCWRLARQLVAEHGLAVRLWVDDLASLLRICPESDPKFATQHLYGVEIRRWASPFPDVEPGQVVIEAFGCELPSNYLSAMANRPTKPVWINLEYLSAENWVEGCHALPSPHPQLPLTKHFFFPGFTPQTGGLLRERDLLARRDTFAGNLDAFWQSFNLPSPHQNETTVSLFCYDTAPIADLLTAWQQAPTPVRCLLPEGKALQQVARHFGRTSINQGDTLQRGNLTLYVLPFLRQQDYDHLLWASDVNFVRGEDSFVRAQWAGKPMVWQIYFQVEDAHLIKLEAFLDRYCDGLDQIAADSMRTLHQGWNTQTPLHWNAFQKNLQVLRQHAGAWTSRLVQQPDLASNLVIFCKNRL